MVSTASSMTVDPGDPTEVQRGIIERDGEPERDRRAMIRLRMFERFSTCQRLSRSSKWDSGRSPPDDVDVWSLVEVLLLVSAVLG